MNRSNYNKYDFKLLRYRLEYNSPQNSQNWQCNIYRALCGAARWLFLPYFRQQQKIVDSMLLL